MLILEVEQMAQTETGDTDTIQRRGNRFKKEPTRAENSIKRFILKKQVCGFYYWDLHILI